MRLLGWTHVPCHYTDETDPQERRAIELEENIQRSELPWPDRMRSVEQWHNIQCDRAKSRGEEWTQQDTADELGVDQTSVSNYLKMARDLDDGDPAIIEAIRGGEKYSTVKGIIDRRERREAELRLQEFHRSINGKTEQAASIIKEDFTEWVETYDGPRFNFVHCDFPYGIGADEMHQGNSVATHGGYDDSEETYKHLVEVLCRNVPRICTESCHFMFWFSMHHFRWTFDYITDNTDIVLDPFPLVWHKSDNIGLLPDPQGGPRRIYETCLFGSRGDLPIVRSVSNLFPCHTDREYHMSAKPEPMLRHFFRMFVDTNTIMLDPTCGSGTALCAAETLGAAHVLGLEINEEYVERANLLLGKARRTRSVELLETL